MLRFFLAVMIGLTAGNLAAFADAHVVQKFDGSDVNTSTATFTVQDKWEVLWFSPRPISLTLLSADGTIITGIRGSFKGSFYQPKGGTYYIQLNSEHPEMKVPWHIVIAEVVNGAALSGPDANPMLSSPGDPNYAPPASVLAPGTVAQTAPGTNPNMPFAPQNAAQTMPAPTNIATAPAPPPTPPASPAPASGGKMTDDQARAVVLIVGDNAEGTGFLVKTADGPVVVTNIHVIANNPHLKVTTNSGAQVTLLSAKGASDRDLAMLAIQDANFNYLDLSTTISQTVQPGDEVITPGNSQGGEVMLNTAGKVLGIGPERIEFDNPIYHGNSGGPIFHTKSGKVLGVVTEAIKVVNSDDLDKASFASRNSAISGSMRYFGLRLDTVPSWIPIDMKRLQTESLFLDQFHKQSLCLDSFLNTPANNNNQGGNASSSDSDPNADIYKTDDKIMKANDNYNQQTSGADTAQDIQAARSLVFDLQGIADTDVDQIKNMNNFYTFDQERAQEEYAYRRALKDELDSISNNVDRLGRLPRTNSSN
ncbi:MAG: serine protease [Methylacidiphilales bacterium]|nr:serine protease [Candidatus Methylacidiphilales bacterium]